MKQLQPGTSVSNGLNPESRCQKVIAMICGYILAAASVSVLGGWTGRPAQGAGTVPVPGGGAASLTTLQITYQVI